MTPAPEAIPALPWHRRLLRAFLIAVSLIVLAAGIPAAILLFNKGKTHGDVVFIDASREFDEAKNQNLLSEAHIEKIVATHRAFKTVEKYAYRATSQEIADNDYNLNIPRYVDTFEEEEEIDLDSVKQEIASLEDQLAAVRKKMDGYLKELGL